MTPTIPQPPDKCPACEAAIYNDDDVNGLRVVQYGCGRSQTQHPAKDYWMVYKTCPQAENAAIALRAERDALTARLAELQAVCDAARLALRALEDVQLEVERMNSAAIPRTIGQEEFVHRYEIKPGAFHTLIGRVRGGLVSMAIVDLIAALASGAVVEGEVTK